MTQVDATAKTVLQAFAIVLGASILSLILHKGYGDISLIAQKHPGADFWLELARYLIGNLAGGAKR